VEWEMPVACLPRTLYNGAIQEADMQQFKVIKGTFHVKSYQPDGDSIRFMAENPAAWDSFTFTSAAKKKAAKKQLRIEAIDALETHYNGYHQPRPFAIAALEQMLKLLGITDVHYSLSVTTIVDADDAKPGYIITSGVDRYDRPISFIFPASAKLTDGALLTADEIPLEKSVNYKLARDGLVYPTFYTTTDRRVAAKIRKAVATAHNAARGLWAIDRTRDLTIWDMRTLQDDYLVMPKLFRRLVEFFDNYGDFEALPAYMARQKDNLQLWEDTTPRSLAELMTFDVSGRRMGLATPVEDILFSPKG
jgi:endonuclease YncB( thermonuclease family)